MWASEDDEQPTALSPWKAKEVESPANPQEFANKGFVRFMKRLWASIRGYTASDIDRLKEGAVRQVEGKGNLALAEAEAKIAEASKLHAEAEKIRAESQRIQVGSEIELLNAKVAAFERFEAATSRIRQQGGEVAFSSEELKALIGMKRSANKIASPKLVRAESDED